MGKKKRKQKDDDASLLAELATLDEVEAVIPTGAEHDKGITPPWCELVLSIKRFDDGTLKPSHPLNARLPLRRHDGELIVQVLSDVLHPERSLSAAEEIWKQLDAVFERIQRRVNKGRDPLKVDVGTARGLTTALALIERPTEPDEDAIRATVVERYELRHGITTPEE